MNIIRPPTHGGDHDQHQRLVEADQQDRRRRYDEAPDQAEVELALVGSAQVDGLDHVGGQPAGVVDDAERRGEQREGADDPEEGAEPGADARP